MHGAPALLAPIYEATERHAEALISRASRAIDSILGNAYAIKNPLLLESITRICAEEFERRQTTPEVYKALAEKNEQCRKLTSELQDIRKRVGARLEEPTFVAVERIINRATK